MSKRKSLGTGIGKGHGTNTADFPIIRDVTEQYERKTASAIDITFKDHHPRWYKMGKVKALLTLSPEWGYTLSISRNDRYPTWDEVAHLRYELIPDEHIMAMVLPSRDEYINIHNFCFILREIKPDDYIGSQRLDSVD